MLIGLCRFNRDVTTVKRTGSGRQNNGPSFAFRAVAAGQDHVPTSTPSGRPRNETNAPRGRSLLRYTGGDIGVAVVVVWNHLRYNERGAKRLSCGNEDIPRIGVAGNTGCDMDVPTGMPPRTCICR